MDATLEHARDRQPAIESRSLGLGADELGAIIGAVNDRADVAAADVAEALARGRAVLELELARMIGA